MTKYLGAYSFVPFAIILLSSFLFAAFVLPETQGTTPEELAAEMTHSLSESVVYQGPTEDTAVQIDVEWRKAMEQLQREVAAHGPTPYSAARTLNAGTHAGASSRPRRSAVHSRCDLIQRGGDQRGGGRRDRAVGRAGEGATDG